MRLAVSPIGLSKGWCSRMGIKCNISKLLDEIFSGILMMLRENPKLEDALNVKIHFETISKESFLKLEG